MRRTIRTLAITAGALTGILLLVLAAGLATMQTTWFKNKVREEVVAAIQDASGGVVELGSFSYDWRTLTAEFRNMVVHGTEAPGMQPLFRADSIRIGLKIVSVFERDIDIASLVIDRPRIHLLVGADGSTNIPSPKLGRRSTGQTVEALLKLKVRHFEFLHGAFEADARNVPLSAHGQDLFILLTYDRRGPRYNMTVSSQYLQFESPRWSPVNVQLNASAQLEKDRLTIRQARFAHDGSNVEASGTIRHFVRPIVDFEISSRLALADVGRIAGFADLHGGEFSLSGKAHYDESAALTFSGRMAGHHVAYSFRSPTLRDLDFQSDVAADRRQAIFSHLSLSALGAHLNGRAATPGYRELQVDGTLSGLNIPEAGVLLVHQRLPWAGIAAGVVHVAGSLEQRVPAFTVQTKLRIAPGASGIPVSGDVDVTYRSRADVLEFGSSHLQLPNTQLSFSGIPGGSLHVSLDTTNLDEIKPTLSLAHLGFNSAKVLTLANNGSAHFDGTLAGRLQNPQVAGNVALAHFRMQGETWDEIRSHIIASATSLEVSSTSIDRAALHASGSGRIGLSNWRVATNSSIRLQAQFRGLNLAQFTNERLTIHLPVMRGMASGSIDASGSLIDPQGSAQLTISNLDAYGEKLNAIQMAAVFGGNSVRVDRGRIEAGPAILSFSGAYKHGPMGWGEGDVQVKIDSNGFPVASLTPAHKYTPGLNAQFEIHAEAAAHVAGGHIQPTNANGTAVFRRVTVNNIPYGSVAFTAVTHGLLLDTNFSGDLRGSHISGTAQVQLIADNPTKGELHLDRIELSTLNAIVNGVQSQPLPVEGSLSGRLSFEGPLQQFEKWHAAAEIQQVQLTSKVAVAGAAQTYATDLIFRNLSPIVLEASNGIATVRSFEMGGKDTRLDVSGSISYLQQRPMSLNVHGSMDMRFFQLLDPNVQASGESLVAASVRGTVSDPAINGTVQLKNGSFAFRDIPNGLTAVNGTVRFDRDRATIQKLTAQTGGGELSLGGFVTFGRAGPLVYRLEAKAENVRFRYASGISATGSADLRLTGTSESSILSGTATISRAVLNPNTDVGNLLASVGAPVESPTNERDFLTGMQFDIRLESAPNLQFNTSLSRDVQAGIDLRLRGTPDRPIVLGSVSANQGDIRVFGTKYTINRGTVSFVNPAKIEPVLDLDLQTEAHGVVVDITVSGTLSKLNINYRSDPPMQPRDIIALLAVGHTPDPSSNLPNAQVGSDVGTLQASANTVLGQAISPSSNRLSKLFGITNIKIDPMVQGITNTPQARLTIEQSISRQITVTYVTNLAETSEQIFRLEWAFSSQYSVVAVRDDNGEFGIDLQYRKRFK